MGPGVFFCKTQPKLKIASPIWFSLLSTSDFRRWSSRAWERRARFAVADHQALSTVGASPLSGRCGTRSGGVLSYLLSPAFMLFNFDEQ